MPDVQELKMTFPTAIIAHIGIQYMDDLLHSLVFLVMDGWHFQTIANANASRDTFDKDSGVMKSFKATFLYAVMNHIGGKRRVVLGICNR